MFRIGSATIVKVHEMDLNGMTLQQLMPGFDAREFARHPEWLPDGTRDGAGHAYLSLHCWVVRHEGRTMLIDTGAGNGKSRPQQMVLDHLDNPFIERLKAAGVSPEQVDVVLHTHIHSDHVGWNTRLADGEWIPTFPNADVVCSDLEWRYGAALTDGDEDAVARCRQEAGFGEPVRIPVSGTFADSMRPLDGRVAIKRIPIDGAEVLPGIRFIPTPGHSLCHAAIELVSEGETALFGGDVFHHAAEIYDPELVSMFCEYPEVARRSRRTFLDHAAETRATVFTGHFPRSSAGRINKGADTMTWRFVDPAPA